MADIFISYANPDREFAARLAKALETCGLSVWWDRHIKVGQSYDEVIEQALDNAKGVIVLWSRHSIVSEWVKTEAASAAKRRVLIPVLINDVEPPLEFRRRQSANLIDWTGDLTSGGFQALCEGIAITGAPLVSRIETSPNKVQTKSKRSRVALFASIVGLALVIGGAAYLVQRQRITGQSDPEARDSSSKTNLSVDPKARVSGVGTLDFKWPGIDCWEIVQDGKTIVGHDGAWTQSLQPGTYTVKPCSSGVFLPFSVTIRPGITITTDAMAGVLDFHWPGQDCWQIFRGDDLVASHDGSWPQPLQAGKYTVKPCSGTFVFKPFQVEIVHGQTIKAP